MWGRLLGRQPPIQVRRRFFEEGLQGTLTVHSTLGPVQIAGGVGQVASADLPQPAGLLASAPSPELSPVALSFQQRLLDKVGGIQLPLEPIAFAEMLALKCREMVAGIPPLRPGGASRWACTVVNPDP